MGITVGAVATWKQFALDVRYNEGLWTLSEKEDFEIRNRVLSILIGYYFPLKKK